MLSPPPLRRSAKRMLAMPRSTTVLPPTGEYRTCLHCGGRFYADGRSRTCRECRRRIWQPAGSRNPDLRHLGRRERQLSRLVAQGLRNKEIAHELGLSEGTVKEYMHVIFRKLAITSRVELALYAVAHGLDQPEA